MAYDRDMKKPESTPTDEHCSYCGSVLVVEDCPRYGNGAEHASVEADYQASAEQDWVEEDPAYWDHYFGPEEYDPSPYDGTYSEE